MYGTAQRKPLQSPPSARGLRAVPTAPPFVPSRRQPESGGRVPSQHRPTHMNRSALFLLTLLLTGLRLPRLLEEHPSGAATCSCVCELFARVLDWGGRQGATVTVRLPRWRGPNVRSLMVAPGSTETGPV
jgi:hypothetical protein